MTQKITGNAFSTEVIVDSIKKYQVFTTLNIKTTNNIEHVGQRNFNRIIQAISFRVLPVSIEDSKFVVFLSKVDAPTLDGPGYTFVFGVEQEDVFENFGDKGTVGPVGYLIDELDELSLVDSTVITKGSKKNTEFVKL